ncbi:MAG: hypothetical protein CMH54_07430 [Myxococcales bacterium]|nr:hypothetical protein [Myxococcales bacterium]
MAIGCANSGPMPSSAYDEQANCPMLDSYLETTFALFDNQGLPALQSTLQSDLDTGTRSIVLNLLFEVLDVIPATELSQLEDATDSDQFEGLKGLIVQLLDAIDQLDSNTRTSFLGGLHRTSQACSLKPILHLMHRLLSASTENRNGLDSALRSFGDLMANSDADAWFESLSALLPILAHVDEHPEALEDFVAIISEGPDDPSNDVLELLQDPEFVSSLSALGQCMELVEQSQDFALLHGLSQMLASGHLAMETSTSSEPEGAPSTSSILGFLSAILEQDTLVTNMQMALGWLLEPSRFEVLLADIRTLINSGAVEELIGLSTAINSGDCHVEPSP